MCLFYINGTILDIFFYTVLLSLNTTLSWRQCHYSVCVYLILFNIWTVFQYDFAKIYFKTIFALIWIPPGNRWHIQIWTTWAVYLQRAN